MLPSGQQLLYYCSHFLWMVNLLPSNNGTSVDRNFMTIIFLNGTRQSLLAILFETTITFSHCIENLPYFAIFTVYTLNEKLVKLTYRNFYIITSR